MSLCEENCDLIEYDLYKEKAKCSCDIKLSININSERNFNKNDFFKSFTDVKNIINLNIMKCYKTVFIIKRLFYNYGFIIAISIIILFFISLFIFIFISFSKLKKDISIIIFMLNMNGNPMKKRSILKQRYKYKNKLIKDKFNTKKDIHWQITQNISGNSLNKMNKKINSINNSTKKIIHKIMHKTDFELNSINYGEALKYDHRNYCQYYISLLAYDHPFLFSFAFINDYNSKIIKMFLFFFSFELELAINALFFTDDTMHKIYQDKGKYNLLYQIPQILYSSLISRFIDILIRNFALSQDNIVQFKKGQMKKNLKKKAKKLLKILKIKFSFFFLLTFIILIFLGYYITCFCGVYINTQIHLIKDTIISLIISLLIPLVLFLIPGIFRITYLKIQKNNRKLLYQFSLFLENWLC